MYFIFKFCENCVQRLEALLQKNNQNGNQQEQVNDESDNTDVDDPWLCLWNRLKQMNYK